MMAQIREYKPKDKEACLTAFKSNVPLFFTKEEIADFIRFLDTLQSRSEDSKTYFYVVVLENEILGCGGFGDKDNTGVISLAWGLIHSDFHKKRFGDLLLKYRLAQIDKIFPSGRILVDTTQFSVGFYEKSGFKITSITNDYYSEGMHRYDLEYNKTDK
jgi:ribosomal protein S18 acetylase RimI-like enzyme